MIQQIWKHKGVRYVTLGWGLFCTENLVLSENRTYIIENIGLKYYRTIYGTLSTISTLSIGYGMLKYPKGDLVMKGSVGLGRRACGLLFHFISLALLSQSMPEIKFKDNQNQQTDSQQLEQPDNIEKEYPQGVQKVTRHPSLYFIGFYGLGSAITTLYWNRVLYGLLPLASVTILSNHQDSRFKRGLGGELDQQMQDKSANFPFVAFITGKQNFVDYINNDLKINNLSLALAGAVLINLRRGRI